MAELPSRLQSDLADGAVVTLQAFTRVPTLGRVKTRLASAMGELGALEVHRALAEHALAELRRVDNVRRELWLDGVAEQFVDDPWVRRQCALDAGLTLRRQMGADLGARMLFALAAGCSEFGAAAVREIAAGAVREIAAGAASSSAGAVLFGTDAPLLDAAYLGAACAALRAGADLVIGPVEDGGYVLIGMRAPQPSLFEGMRWGTSEVCARTLERARAARLRVHLLPMLWDVDRPEDVARLRAIDQFAAVAASADSGAADASRT